MRTRLAAILERELGEQEMVLWSGQPDPLQAALGGLSWSFAGGMMMVIAAGWVSIVFEFPRGMLNSSGFFELLPLVLVGAFVMVGILLALIGTGILLIPVWIWRRARATLYVVTARRCMILIAAWPEAADGYSHARLVSVQRVEHAPGRGDVLIAIREEPNAAFHWKGLADLFRRVRFPKSGSGHRIAFRGILEASLVENLLLKFHDRKCIPS
jgi:hypothetical protein